MTETLDKGIALAKAGDKAQALSYLKQAVQQEPRNPTAWLWLAGVLDDSQKQRQCLQQVLNIDPTNIAARRGLEKLDASQPSPVPQPNPLPQPVTPSPTSSPAFTDPFQSSSEAKPSPFVMDESPANPADANWVSPFQAFSQGKLDKSVTQKPEQPAKPEATANKKSRVVAPPREPAPSMPGKPYFLAMGTMLAIPMIMLVIWTAAAPTGMGFGRTSTVIIASLYILWLLSGAAGLMVIRKKEHTLNDWLLFFFPLTLGPFFYLYTRSLANENEPAAEPKNIETPQKGSEAGKMPEKPAGEPPK
jgi:hypothetical protein